MIEFLLCALGIAAAAVLLWAFRKPRMTDAQAALEVLRLRASGVDEDKIPRHLLEAYERHGERMRRESGGDWS